MISKELFVNAIETYNRQIDIDCKIDEELGKVCGGYVCFNTENLIYDMFLQVLGNAIGDYETLIWWLFDAPDNSKFVYETDENGKEIEIDLTTPERLYDYIVQNSISN